MYSYVYTIRQITLLTFVGCDSIEICTPDAPDDGAGGGPPFFKDIFNWWRLRAADESRVSRARFMGALGLCFRIASANERNSQSSSCGVRSATVSDGVPAPVVRTFVDGGNGGFEEYSLKDFQGTIIAHELLLLTAKRHISALRYFSRRPLDLKLPSTICDRR